MVDSEADGTPLTDAEATVSTQEPIKVPAVGADAETPDPV